MYIDSHTHIDNILEGSREDTAAAVIARARTAGLRYLVQVTVAVEGFQWACDLAQKHASDGVLFTLGIQPSSEALDRELLFLDDFVKQAVAAHPALLVGIGECGLDYYRMHQDKRVQNASFRHQLYLAKQYRLPVIIHTRDATEDTLAALKEYAPVWGIMHCFPGNKQDAKRFLDLGFYISYAGNVTYRKADVLHESAAYVPAERLLVETDAPYLTPVPLRGKGNEPQHVVHTYRFLAELRREPLERLEEQVLANFEVILGRRYK